MIHLSADEARRLGLSPVPKEKDPNDDGMNKLERAFLQRALNAFHNAYVLPSGSIKLKLAGNTWYCPDFVIRHAGWFNVYEIKGFMRDDAAVKIKVAAQMYGHFFCFVIVTRPRGKGWQCRNVTSNGISRNVYCPEWLR